MYRVSRIESISNGEFDLDRTKWTSDKIEEKDFLQYQDILFSHINSMVHIGKTAIYESNEKIIHGANLLKLRANKDLILPKYALYIFKDIRFINLVKKFTNQAVNQASVNTKSLKSINIPVPSIEIQNQIVEELDGYQKIIDGCRQVVENYKPSFYIKNNWKSKKIKEISKLTYGLGQAAKEKGKYRIIRITDINENGLLIESDKKYVDIKNDEKKYILKKEEVLVARTGATYGKCLFFESNEPSVYAGYLIKLEFDKELILPKFFWIFSQSENFNSQKNKLVVGGGQPQFNANTLARLLFQFLL